MEAGHLSRARGARRAAPYDDLVHPVLGSFYDEVLRELIAAMGAACSSATCTRSCAGAATPTASAARTVERGRPGSPVRSPAKPSARRELAQAPIGRTIGYMVLGFVVMIAGIASLSM